MATDYDFSGAGLTGAKRDAAVALTELFESYGLGSLAPKIIEYLRQDYSADTISLLLQDTPEYKKRFAANEARQKRGLPVLSPAEYLAVERQYRQILSAAGVPSGFYDQPSDFQKWIEQDIAPQEIQMRVEAARSFLDRADPYEMARFKQFYTTGDMIAFALDPDRAANLVGKQFSAATVAGQAERQGVSIDRQLAESLAGMGVDAEAAQRGFSLVAQERQNAEKLANIEGDQLTVNDLIQETFYADAQAAEKRRRLGEKETARFSGSSGVRSNTLSTSKGGSL